MSADSVMEKVEVLLQYEELLEEIRSIEENDYLLCLDRTEEYESQGRLLTASLPQQEELMEKLEEELLYQKMECLFQNGILNRKDYVSLLKERDLEEEKEVLSFFDDIENLEGDQLELRLISDQRRKLIYEYYPDIKERFVLEGHETTRGEIVPFDYHIDTASHYYVYDEDSGNLNVAHTDNPHWPFDGREISFTEEDNRLICISFSSGRLWETEFPKEDYPLPADFDEKRPQLRTDQENIRDLTHSIIQIRYIASEEEIYHDIFIEYNDRHYDAEGHIVKDDIVISETNTGYNSGNEYGFRLRYFPSFEDYFSSLKEPFIVGILTPESVGELR